jgi:dipeptidyl aminopeptidase/acylaminoacyl peptidase
VSRIRGGGGVLLVALLLLGCKTPGFELADLPDAPIAFVYRTVEETERVQDELEQQQKKARGQGAEVGLQVELERLEQLTGWRSAEDSLRDQLGRVRLYVAPAGHLEAAEFAPRGARPLEWSADRTRLLFSAASRDRLQLFEWVAATGEVHQLTRGEWAHPDGCYGPDGAFAYVEVVTQKSKPPASRIWIQRPREPARAVTEGPADGQPSWSRDGGRIVYAVSDPRRGDLLRWVDPASGEGGLLTRGRSPVFTPDGEWIVYSAPGAAGWKLWRMRADGSGKRNFGKSAFHENDPAVSPDGRFVVFAGSKQERSAISRLFVRPFDGSADRQLELSGSALLPVW